MTALVPCYLTVFRLACFRGTGAGTSWRGSRRARTAGRPAALRQLARLADERTLQDRAFAVHHAGPDVVVPLADVLQAGPVENPHVPVPAVRAGPGDPDPVPADRVRHVG